MCDQPFEIVTPAHPAIGASLSMTMREPIVIRDMLDVAKTTIHVVDVEAVATREEDGVLLANDSSVAFLSMSRASLVISTLTMKH